MQTVFHLAFPVSDLAKTRDFYERILKCKVGRTSDCWIDFDFFGHQITAHLNPEEARKAATSQVDGDAVPVRHFGAVLEWDAWEKLADHLKKEAVPFLLEPHIRFRGKPGEQGTFFVSDPSGNALEFKTFRDHTRLFAAGGKYD